MAHTPILLMAILLATTCLVTSCHKEEQAASQAPKALSVRVDSPQLRLVTEWQEFTGRFQAVDRVEIRSRVSGYLKEIKFTDGQDVQKGDVLFVIDQRPFQIALKTAKARFELATKEFNRAESLRKTSAISEEDYDERLQEMRVASAQVEEAELNLEFTEVKAPFDGRVSRNLISAGSLITGGSLSATHLTTLVTVSPIEFYFEGSEADIMSYIRARESGEVNKARGESHPVFVKLQDEQAFIHEGVFNFVDNEINPETSTIEARAIFDNKKETFIPGMFGRMRAAWYTPKERLLVPDTLIGTEQNRKFVYVLDEDNKAVRKYVSLGHLTDDGQRVIKSGLEKKDRMIVGHVHLIRPGVLISPIPHNHAESDQKES